MRERSQNVRTQAPPGPWADRRKRKPAAAGPDRLPAGGRLPARLPSITAGARPSRAARGARVTLHADSRSIASERPSGLRRTTDFHEHSRSRTSTDTGVCGLHGPGPARAPCSAWQAARARVLRPTLAGDRRRTVTWGVLNASQASRRQAGREWGLRPHARAASPLGAEAAEARCGRHDFRLVRRRVSCSAVVALAGAGPIRGPLVGRMLGR
jgi:hypothetical protein